MVTVIHEVIKIKNSTRVKGWGGGHEVPQWYPAAKPNDLNSVLETHMVDGENQLLQITF